MTPAAAAVVAGMAAAAAWRARSLTRGGALAAFVVATLLLTAGGEGAAAALLAFFISSSLVSRLESRGLRLDPKQGPRDAWQVIANGGAAAVAATLAALAGSASAALWVSTCSLAVAGADTWATSFGSRARKAPRHILSRRSVPAGSSGGVTRAGTLAALAGAAMPGLAAGMVARDTALPVAAVMIGWTGMFADSLLGATVQGRFQCSRCDVPSEWRRHRCGARTVLVGGFAWLTNDGVNAMATVLGAAAGAGAWLWLAR